MGTLDSTFDPNINNSQQQKTPPPDNNMVWAILTTIFCFMPLGIVAIVYAAKVNNLWLMGYHAAANDAARKAKRWAIASLITSVSLWILYILLIVVLGVVGYIYTQVEQEVMYSLI